MIFRSDTRVESTESSAGAVAPTPVTTSTRPGGSQIAIAGLLSFALLVIGVISTPLAEIPLTPVPGFMTAFGTGMFVMNALLAALLLSKGSIEQRSDVARLGAAYLFVAAIFVPLTMSFKDGFVPGTLIGDVASSVWLWSAWHAGFGLAICWYALRIGSNRPGLTTGRIVLAVSAVVLFIAVMTTAGIDYLPALLWNGKTFFSGSLYCIPVVLIAIDVVALLLCLRLMARTTEQLWVTVAMVAACFDLWLTVRGANRFALGWYLSKCGSLVTSFVVIASLFNDIAKLYAETARANRVLTELANRDGLTGVRNRRFFDEALEAEWVKALPARAPLSLLMVDIDFFKQFNDRYGHVLGDDCLKAVARCLVDTARGPGASVSRYGGEEFAILLPGVAAEEASEIAERLRQTVQGLAIPHAHSLHSGLMTISVGVSTQIPDTNGKRHALLRKADSALYLAKQMGKNRVSGASETRQAQTAVADVISFEKRAANG